jgi:uncharacterized protein (TIGR03435 family)
MRQPALVFAIAAVGCGAAMAQSFDVASVKSDAPVPAGQNLSINLGSDNHGTVTLTNTTLSECIRYAYRLASEEQISGPDWIRDRQFRFDIVAKASPDTPFNQLLAMMRNLLTERFHLVLHTEEGPVTYLELQVDKNGSKLRPSAQDGITTLKAYGRGLIFYDHLSLPVLPMLLSRQLRLPVIDKTGITGWYDVKLEWIPDDLQSAGDAPGTPTRRDADIYTAVREQLGLQLTMKKTPIDVLVIDHADEVPVAN